MDERTFVNCQEISWQWFGKGAYAMLNPESGQRWYLKKLVPYVLNPPVYVDKNDGKMIFYRYLWNHFCPDPNSRTFYLFIEDFLELYEPEKDDELEGLLKDLSC